VRPPCSWPKQEILTGTVEHVEKAADGWGANVRFTVTSSAAADGHADFTGAEPGATLEIFAAQPELIEPGAGYELTATVLGGPEGERIVMEDARPLKDG
jgi:hypothetical protein